MDTDGSQNPPTTADYPHSDLTRKIIGAAFEVQRQLGVGFLEKVYEAALEHELQLRGVDCQVQASIAVAYKGKQLGYYVCDLLVDGTVLCEIKAVRALATEHEAQLLNYLKATGTKVGLLLNFGSPRLQIKRMVL